MSHELVDRNKEIYSLIKSQTPWSAILAKFNLKSTKSLWVIKQRYARRPKRHPEAHPAR